MILSKNTNVLVQGITGKEGERATKWMLEYGTKVLCGVTPGKGGQEILGLPVFDSVKEALSKFPEINATSLYVPPRFVKSAALEFIDSAAENSLMHVIAEGVPVHDTAEIIGKAKEKNIRVIGPSSIGLIRPGVGKIGSIGGEENDSFEKGSVAVISKSGGLASEVSLILKKEGLGQSLVVGIGGDVLSGTTFGDLLSDLQKDETTKAVVMVGEVGGLYENEAASKIKSGILDKPVVAFVSGIFAESMPRGTAVGHAGAIIGGEKETRTKKMEELKEAGVEVVDSLDQIGKAVKLKLQ